MRIEKQFEELLPPLTDEEYRQLEENILKDGIRDPLVVWKTPSGNEVLVDGHNRLKIAEKHDLEYQKVYMTFDGFDDVKLWIYRNQIGKRNLIPFQKTEVELKMEPVFKAEAKKRQGTRTDLGNIVQNSAQSEPTKTRDRIAKRAGVSHDTVRKVKYVLQNGSEETKELARSDKISIHDAYTRTVKENEPPKPDIPTVEEEHEAFLEKKRTAPVVTMDEIEADKENQRIIALDLSIDIAKAAEKFEDLMMTRRSLKTIKDEAKALDQEQRTRLISRLRNIRQCTDGLIRALGGN